MAGHNKWSKVKHRKAVVDKRRSKVWSKISRAMIVAARHGGPDPAFNVTLRYAIDEARYANMPRDVIDRAIKKGAGGADNADYQPARYEGYGPGGAAILVDALTDNRARTVGDVRLAFSNHDSSLGQSGSVAYLFDSRGVIEAGAPNLGEDEVIGFALDAGADDAEAPAPADPDPTWTITCDPTRFILVRDALDKAGMAIRDARIEMLPRTRTVVTGEAVRDLFELIDELEELDDVQKVFTNADISPEDAEKFAP